MQKMVNYCAIRSMMRFLLIRKKRSIVTGNLGLFSIYFDGIMGNA
jgi:hypothetical protein